MHSLSAARVVISQGSLAGLAHALIVAYLLFLHFKVRAFIGPSLDVSAVMELLSFL